MIKEKISDPMLDVGLIDSDSLAQRGDLSQGDIGEILGLKQILDEDLMENGKEIDNDRLLEKLDMVIDGIKDSVRGS